jgi:DNA-binding CsgD family transcriptional regulator/tetratricopeptide (TPR) repeat protein
VPLGTRELVGRTSELASLTELLNGAVNGQAGSLLLSGDAGVGKTRLLTEVIRQATERDLIRLVGHCIDFGHVGLPYLPFSEAFGRLANDRPDLVEDLQRDFPPIARLLPQRRLIGAEPPPDAARYEWSELFAAVLGALSRIGEERPAVFIVEDAHWADQSTRDLLGFLLTRLDRERVTLMVSYRSDDLHRRHPLRGSLAEWSRLPGVQRMHLGPLDEADVRALIASLHPGPIPESEVRCIVARAEGNAFFTEELLAASAEQAPSDDFSLVPTRLSDLLIVRLDRVSDGARYVIRLAAVAGRRVPHQMLETVAEMSHTDLDGAVREAVDANILERRGDYYYGFRHALLGDAVYDDLLPGERVRLHAAFASALAKESVSGTAAELARHARESHDVDTAFEASVRAGDEAVAVAAPQEGMRHYEMALELLPRLSAAVKADATSLILTAADAAAAAGHKMRALAFAKEALAGLGPQAPPLQRARVLLAIGTHAATVEAELEGLAASSEALKLVPADPPTELRAHLVTLHARTCSQLGRDDEALRWAREAVTMWQTLGKPELSTDAWTTLAVLEKRVGDPDEASRQFELIAAQAKTAGQIADELRSLFQLAILSFSQGDLTGAVAAYTRCWQRARETGRAWAFYGADARTHLANVQYVRGEWDASEKVVDFAGEQAPPFSEAQLTAAGLAVRAGRGDQSVLDDIPELRPWFKQDGLLAVLSLPQAVEIYTQLGNTEAALAAGDELVAVLTDVWQQPWFMARIRLSALCVAALSRTVTTLSHAQRVAAIDRGEQLHADGNRAVDTGPSKPGPEGRAWLARLDAEWARLRWLADIDPPSGEEHIDLWRTTVAAFDSEVYEHARSQARLAEVLKAAGRQAEAAQLADEAAAVATRLRAEPLLREIRALNFYRPGQPAASTGPDSLTPRESEVLDQLVAGRTNRQIARQLYISEKTVSVHVSNILAKLGVRSRAEAAALARRS